MFTREIVDASVDGRGVALADLVGEEEGVVLYFFADIGGDTTAWLLSYLLSLFLGGCGCSRRFRLMNIVIIQNLYSRIINQHSTACHSLKFTSILDMQPADNCIVIT